MIKRVIAIHASENYGTGKAVWNYNSYWSNQRYFISESDRDTLDKVIKKIENTKVNIKPNDVIYTSPASEIPRFKLKEFINENKLKRTTRANKSTKIIINKGYFDSIKSKLVKDSVMFFKSDFVKNQWSEFINKVHNSSKDEYNSIYKATKDKDHIMYTDMTDYNGKVINKHPNLKKDISIFGHQVPGTIIDLYRDSKLGNIINMLSAHYKDILSGKIEVIFDEDLFVDLNKEGIELDDEYLQTLRDMLFSDDKANVKLGFEMMSNLVIDQPTLLSMSFLLNELYHQKGFRPSYYTSDNSNLRSLLKLFKTKNIAWDSDWKTFGSGLRMNFKDGKEGEIVKKFLLDNINREFKLKNKESEALVDIVFATETN